MHERITDPNMCRDQCPYYRAQLENWEELRDRIRQADQMLREIEKNSEIMKWLQRAVCGAEDRVIQHIETVQDEQACDDAVPQEESVSQVVYTAAQLKQRRHDELLDTYVYLHELPGFCVRLGECMQRVVDRTAEPPRGDA